MNTNPPIEETILEPAQSLAAPEARQAFLHGDCGGNEALRARVQSLIEAHGAACGFLADKATEGVPTFPIELQLDERPCTVIDRYELLQQIVEGGCGVAHMAERYYRFTAAWRSRCVSVAAPTQLLRGRAFPPLPAARPFLQSAPDPPAKPAGSRRLAPGIFFCHFQPKLHGFANVDQRGFACFAPTQTARQRRTGDGKSFIRLDEGCWFVTVRERFVTASQRPVTSRFQHSRSSAKMVAKID